MWLRGICWSCFLWDIIYLDWRHIYNHILQLRFCQDVTNVEKSDHWETLNIETPLWHAEMGSGFWNNRCDCRLHTKLYFQVPGGSESKCQSLIKWVNIIVRQKKSSGFFLFVRGVLENIFSLWDFASQSGQVGFLVENLPLFCLSLYPGCKGKMQQELSEVLVWFRGAPLETALQSLLNDPTVDPLCAHFILLCLNPNRESGEHHSASEIALFLENREQFQDDGKCSLNISHAGMSLNEVINPSPHPAWFVECCESSFYWARCMWLAAGKLFGLKKWGRRMRAICEWINEKKIHQETYKYQQLHIEMVVEKSQWGKAL